MRKYAILFIVAFVYRLSAIGRYVTPDEIAWVYRSLRFRDALLTADWANTIQTSHPGITTTWLGALGIQLTLWLNPETYSNLDWARMLVWLSPETGEPYQQLVPFLTAGRLSVITITSLGILLIVWLLRRMDRPGAWWVGLILALDPFTAGLSGLLHTDALLGTFTTIALLAALSPRRHWKMVGLAGGAAGLAALTKLPGVLVVLFVLTITILPSPNPSQRGDRRRKPPPLRGGLRGGVLLTAIIITCTIILPAIWADPAHVLEIIRSGGAKEAGISAPTFFLGEKVTNPSILFYPLVILLRLSPAACVALVLSGRQTSDFLKKSDVLWIGAFIVLFIVGLEQSTRSFDRYALPLTMLLTVTAASHLQVANFGFKLATFALIALYGIFNWAYPLHAFNWFTGGRPIAHRIITIGWGELDSTAARTITPSDPPAPLFTENVPAVAPFYSGDVTLLRLASVDDFTADTITITRPDHPIVASATTTKTIRYGTTERIIATNITSGTPITIDRTTTWQFVNAARLDGFGLKTFNETVIVRLIWGDGAGSDFTAHVAITDPDAPDDTHEYAAVDIPLIDLAGQSSRTWQPNTPHTVELRIPLDALDNVNMPQEGAYDVRLSLFGEDGGRIGVYENDQFAGVQVVIGRITP